MSFGKENKKKQSLNLFEEGSQAVRERNLSEIRKSKTDSI
jgi:hypothetical protein